MGSHDFDLSQQSSKPFQPVVRNQPIGFRLSQKITSLNKGTPSHGTHTPRLAQFQKLPALPSRNEH
jgi:hypothetical protein